MDDATLIISDVHLGRPRGAVATADELRPVWAGVRRLILNGDSAEMHHPQYKGRATAEMFRLVELCQADGVEVSVLAGNHDPYLSVDRYLELAGGSVFVTHGDVLHPAIAPWSVSAGLLKRAHDQALRLHSDGGEPGLEARLAAARHASYAEWEELERQARQSPLVELIKRPWAILQLIQYWRESPRLAADFIKEHAPDARFIVFGHTHWSGVWEVGGRVVINTGSFDLPSRPRAVVLDGERLRVHPIVMRAGQWRRSERVLADYELHQTHDADDAAPLHA